LWHETLLRHLYHAVEQDPHRVINWVAAGPHLFVRYWSRGEEVDSPIAGAVWHSYDLKDLAQRFAWFPVEGGKERRRKMYVPLEEPEVRSFGNNRNVGGRRK